MNNLFFKLQENKQVQRQILILQHLNKKHQPSTTQELIEITKTSPPTLRSDIEALRHLLSGEVRIIFQKRVGYQLILKHPHNLEALILDLAKHTPVFQLIDQYFHGRISSLQSVATTLYSSQSRIRKIIKQMNKELQIYRLQWRTTPMKIQGNEADIRCFLFDFYQSFSIDSISELIFFDSKFIESVQTITGLPIDPLRAKLWLAIVMKRVSHRYPITLEPTLKEDVSFRESFMHFKKRSSHLFKSVFRISPISDDELIWLYVVFLNCIVYSSTDADQFCYFEDRQDYHKSQPFFLPMLSSVRSTDKVYAFSVNLQLLSQVSSHYQKNPLKNSIDLPVHLKKLHEDWCIYLKTPTVQHFFSILHPEHVALSFAMFHYSILKTTDLTRIRVLFSFHGSAGLSSYLITLVEQIIPRTIQAIFTTTPHLHKKEVPSNLSLVVCNHRLIDNIYTCPVFTLSSLPQEKEWLELHHLFFNMSALS